jgi:DNA glycosylase AlkZ-like
MARRGLIVNGPSRGQEITYVRVDRWLDGTGDRTPPVDPAAAAAEYLRRYLAAYGPASKKDYARWLGMRLMRPVTEAFATLGEEVASVRVVGRPLLALRSDLDELAAAPDPATWEPEPPVRLLPGFDTFVLGHADRDHLVPPERKPLVYRTAGWVSPTILAGGAVVGTWEHRVEGADLAVRLSPFDRLSRGARAAAEAEARRLAAFFGRRLGLYT